MSEPMRLDQHDLFSARVDDYLDEREALKRAMPEVEETSFVSKIVYSSWFYLALFGVFGALVGWGIMEPFFSDADLNRDQMQGGLEPETLVVALLLFPMVAAGIGLMLGIAEGLVSRNFGRAALTALVGVGIGFVGALLLIFPAGCIFSISNSFAMGMAGPDDDPNRRVPGGLPLVMMIIGRGLTWAIVAIPAGLGQGIALRSGRMMLNGFLGALFGGFLGGMLFDPIDILFNGVGFPPGFDPNDPDTFDLIGDAWLSRGIGFACIGMLVGLFIGLVEQFTKTAWLMMRAGPLAGKQFVMYKNPTVLGSSPKADIYLFKDDAIEPRHALIHNRGGRFEIEDLETPDGTYVNGIPIKRQILQAGDQIVLGKTVLEFSVKDAG